MFRKRSCVIGMQMILLTKTNLHKNKRSIILIHHHHHHHHHQVVLLADIPTLKGTITLV